MNAHHATGKRCASCVLPGTYRNITFDRNGVCNYCRTYDRLRPKLTNFRRLRKLREDRFDAARGTHDYDCLVGMSGGKDSSWIALQLVQKHGLKCLGFTFDNTFLTEYARANIALVANRLGIDHFYHTVDPELHRQFYRQAVLSFGKPCPGCSYSSYALSYKLAFERGIPLVIHGRSRSQMFRELLPGSPDAFLPFVTLNLSPYDHAANLKATLNARNRLDTFIAMAIPDPPMRERFYHEFFPPTDALRTANLLPEFLGYFLYQPYDEHAMMNELVAELDWKKPQADGLLTHADCAVHDAAGYLHEKVFGHNILAFELSVMIREGNMTRQEAMARLEAENQLPAPSDALGAMCDHVGIDPQTLPAILEHIARKNRRRNRMLRIRNWFLRPRLDL